MTSVNDPNGANYEISVGGIARTHRDVQENAIDATRELAKRNPGAAIEVRDLRDGSTIYRSK